MTGGRVRPARIAVVIVTFNSADVLGGCLAAIPAAAEGVDLVGVVVADNASKDDSLRVAKEADQLPVQVIQVGRNAGYAAGFNVGVKALEGAELDAVILINPDCTLRPGSMRILCDAAQHGRGIIAPKLLNPDGSIQPTLRRRPTVVGAIAESLVGGKRASRIGLGELVFDTETHEHPRSASWVTGAALLITWEALTAVGPWDESFLLYSEETEFIFRAADHGYSLWYEPAAVVEHRGGESAINPQLAALLAVNKVELYRRRNGRLATVAYYCAVLFGAAVRAAAGSRTARASVSALLRPSRRISSLEQLS